MSTGLQEQLHSDACLALFHLSRKAAVPPSQLPFFPPPLPSHIPPPASTFSYNHYAAVSKTPPPPGPVPLLSPSPSSPQLSRASTMIPIPSLLLSNHSSPVPAPATTAVAVPAALPLDSRYHMDLSDTDWSESEEEEEQKTEQAEQVQEDTHEDNSRRCSFMAAKTLESLFFSNPKTEPAAPSSSSIQINSSAPQQQYMTPRPAQYQSMSPPVVDEAIPVAKVSGLIKQTETQTQTKPKSKPKSKPKRKSAAPQKSPQPASPTSESTQTLAAPITAPTEPISTPVTEPELLPSSSTNCTDCSAQFQTTSQLRRHQKIKHQRQMYKCRTCGDLFSSIADRQTHKNNKHFSTIRISVKNQNFSNDFEVGTEVASSRNEAGYFECPAEYCSFVTRIPGYWYDHINSVEHFKGVDPQKRKRRKVSGGNLEKKAATGDGC